MDKLSVNLNGYDVIEYSMAREILYRCGLGARRTADNLLAFQVDAGRQRGFYCDPTCYPDHTALVSLYCDEGVYDTVLHHDGVRPNDRWSEMVDAAELLVAVAQHLLGVRIQSDKIGNGSRHRDLHVKAADALRGKSFDAIEFA